MTALEVVRVTGMVTIACSLPLLTYSPRAPGPHSG